MSSLPSGLPLAAALTLLTALVGALAGIVVALMRRDVDRSTAAVNEATAAKLEAERVKIQAEIQDAIIADLRQHMQYLRDEVDAKDRLLEQSVTVTHKAVEVARREQLHATPEAGKGDAARP